MFKGQSDLCTLSTNSTKHLYKYLTSSGKQFCWNPAATWSIWQEAHAQSCVCTSDPPKSSHSLEHQCAHSKHNPLTFEQADGGYMWLTSSSREFPCGRNQCHWNTAVPISTEVLLYRYTKIFTDFSSSPDKGRFIWTFFCFSFEHLCDQISARGFTRTVPEAALHPVLASSLSCVVPSHRQNINISGIQFVMAVSKAQMASIFWDHYSGCFCCYL